MKRLPISQFGRGRALFVPKEVKHLPSLRDAHAAACLFTQRIELRTSWAYWTLRAKHVPNDEAETFVNTHACQ